jgi:alpha-beta hydrolase superfamily lysophospholipase
MRSPVTQIAFAAAAPICGGGDPAQAKRFAKLPVWAFHGGKDGVVKPQRSREMIEAITAAGGTPKYTEYPMPATTRGMPLTKPGILRLAICPTAGERVRLGAVGGVRASA